MLISDWLAGATKSLIAAGIESARLDCLILLEDYLQQDRAWLLAHPETSLSSEQAAQLATAVERRAQHEPLAYIRGHYEFYGREFLINKNVLVPRPESETMIDLLKKMDLKDAKIADIGTGSGALAITAALETGCVAAAVDIDEACLSLAMRNAALYTAQISCQQGDLLEPFLAGFVPFQPTVLLCNLPYVPTDYAINEAARHEPALALFGGDDGLDLYRRLFTQTEQLATAPTLILTEALPAQHNALAQIASEFGYELQTSHDYIQVFRRADVRS